MFSQKEVIQLLVKSLKESNPAERYKAVKELENFKDGLAEQTLLELLKNPQEQIDILIELVEFFSKKLGAIIIDYLIPHLENKHKLISDAELDEDWEKLIEKLPLYKTIYNQLATFPELMLSRITDWIESNDIAKINDAVQILIITQNRIFIEKLYTKFIADLETYSGIGAYYFRELNEQRTLIFVVFQLLQIYQTEMYKYEGHSLYKELLKAGGGRVLPILIWFLQQEGYIPNLSVGLDGSGLFAMIKEIEKEEKKNVPVKLDTADFIIMLKDESVQKRRLAALLLSAFGELRHIPELVEIAHSNDEILRSISVFALGWLGNADILPELGFAFEHGNSDVKNSAVLGFSKIKGDASYSLLLQALESTYVRVCWNAIQGLISYGEIAVEPLISKFQRTQQIDLQKAIVEALGRLKTQSALSFLKTVLESVKVSEDYSAQILRNQILQIVESWC